MKVYLLLSRINETELQMRAKHSILLVRHTLFINSGGMYVACCIHCQIFFSGPASFLHVAEIFIFDFMTISVANPNLKI